VQFVESVQFQQRSAWLAAMPAEAQLFAPKPGQKPRTACDPEATFRNEGASESPWRSFSPAHEDNHVNSGACPFACTTLKNFLMFTILHWVLLASLFVPMLTLLAIVWILRGIRSLRLERPPVSEKLLRPPGESLRREIEEMDEQINDIIIWTFFGPAFVAAMLLILNAAAVTSIIFITVVAAAFAFLVRRLISLINRRRDYRLGFAGERAVAEELNQLMLDGCRVFHDVPMEPYGNIDHVLVAPTGIYAVETKARRKRKTSTGKRDHEVVFDGKILKFPGAAESRSLDQARQQADRLGVFLSGAVGEPVKVQAIVTLPGWFVTSRVKADIKVLNPKGIRAAVVDSRLPTLPKHFNERVAYQLDQKCRDVDF
jgi:hypothetical protein